jgi:hypothetical protein
MTPLSRNAIFQMAAQKLRQDFSALGVVPHSGLKGDEAAKLVRDFLNDHLPKRFAAGSGFIIDRRDNVSRQTDVVIYDAMNCPVYRASEAAGIFPADNVAAVVEVKSRLDHERLVEAAENIRAAKDLAKTPPPDVPVLVQTQTLGCVFAFDSVSVETLEQHYREVLSTHGLGRHIDLILVLDKCVMTLTAKIKGTDGWAPMFFEGAAGPAAEGSHIGIGTQTVGEASLDHFLRPLLAQLTFFRGIVDHPGFGFPGAQMRVTYLTSLTLETDPQKKQEILKRYADEVREEFAKSPIPMPPVPDEP